jgi:hypothetical protein
MEYLHFHIWMDGYNGLLGREQVRAAAKESCVGQLISRTFPRLWLVEVNRSGRFSRICGRPWAKTFCLTGNGLKAPGKCCLAGLLRSPCGGVYSNGDKSHIEFGHHVGVRIAHHVGVRIGPPRQSGSKRRRARACHDSPIKTILG